MAISVYRQLCPASVLCSSWNSVSLKVVELVNNTHLAAAFCRELYLASVHVHQEAFLDVDTVSLFLFVLGANAFISSAGRHGEARRSIL